LFFFFHIIIWKYEFKTLIKLGKRKTTAIIIILEKVNVFLRWWFLFWWSV